MPNQHKDKTHCKSGHEFTSKNTQWILDAYGNRVRKCITCRNERSKRYETKVREWWAKRPKILARIAELEEQVIKLKEKTGEHLLSSDR